MKKRTLNTRFGIVIGVAFLLLAGSEGAFSQPVDKSKVFDDSKIFEKNYIVRDVLEFQESVRSAADRASLMETVTVTPDGKVETLEISPEEITIFMKAIEAVVDEQGRIHLSEPFKVSGSKRAVLLILDEDSQGLASDTAIVSEPALSDWNRPEEDEAWLHLQPDQSS